MRKFVRNYLRDTILVFEQLSSQDEVLNAIEQAALVTAKALLNGGKLLTAGNGGSAADAQHLAAEFVGRLTADRRAMRAIALTTDSSILTSVTNDYGYDAVFRRQLEGLADRGDIFFAISTSGQSGNIVEALRYCRTAGIITIGLTGRGGGAMLEHCDYPIVVPCSVTSHIQEAHLAIEHLYSTIVEKLFLEGLTDKPESAAIPDAVLHQ